MGGTAVVRGHSHVCARTRAACPASYVRTRQWPGLGAPTPPAPHLVQFGLDLDHICLHLVNSRPGMRRGEPGVSPQPAALTWCQDGSSPPHAPPHGGRGCRLTPVRGPWPSGKRGGRIAGPAAPAPGRKRPRAREPAPDPTGPPSLVAPAARVSQPEPPSARPDGPKLQTREKGTICQERGGSGPLPHPRPPLPHPTPAA